jgi:hypothetical protein
MWTTSVSEPPQLANLATLACGFFLPRMLFDPFGAVFSSVVIQLDIALVLIMFKGDIRLT